MTLKKQSNDSENILFHTNCKHGIQMAKEFINSQDGYVQEPAIDLMNAMVSNNERATTLSAT